VDGVFGEDGGLNVAALKSAARAALVMPAVFALADEVIGKPQTSFLAAFGSFAMLVLVEFAGQWRVRLLAYLGLGCVGALNITLGTLCSRTPWIGAVVMAIVGFVALFAGVLGGYFAAAAPAAILTFVLPVTLPAPNSVVADRLEGWGIAVGAGICAVMLLWPPRARADLSRAAAAAIRVVANFLDGAVSADEARRAVDELANRFLGTQHRPTGPTGPTAALTSIPDELDWLLSFMTPTPELSTSEDRDAIAAAAGTLRAGAARLEGSEQRPDFDALHAARDRVARAVVRRLADVPDIESLDPPFRIRVATYSARQVAAYALVATGADVPELQESDLAHATVSNPALQAAEQVVVEHANFGSVWFQNAVRAAAGLGLAVYIAQSAGLQHGFWVVLGTLSVLRSNALSTGWSIVTALAGTAAGIVLGAALVIGIGTHQSVLWIVLPLAVLLASYAPRAISFAAGQAGFTVTLFILFNIIQPVGWRVGVVRVEDVAIGFAISLGVGLLFWPRGAAALLREQLADAFARQHRLRRNRDARADRRRTGRDTRRARGRRRDAPPRRRVPAIPRRAHRNRVRPRGRRRGRKRRHARPPLGPIAPLARPHGRHEHESPAMRPQPRSRATRPSVVVPIARLRARQRPAHPAGTHPRRPRTASPARVRTRRRTNQRPGDHQRRRRPALDNPAPRRDLAARIAHRGARQHGAFGANPRRNPRPAKSAHVVTVGRRAVPPGTWKVAWASAPQWTLNCIPFHGLWLRQASPTALPRRTAKLQAFERGERESRLRER
jgi:Fusaric acid resistance protein-like